MVKVFSHRTLSYLFFAELIRARFLFIFPRPFFLKQKKTHTMKKLDKIRGSIKTAINKAKEKNDLYESSTQEQVEALHKYYQKVFLAATHIVASYGKRIIHDDILSNSKDISLTKKITETAKEVFKRRIVGLAHGSDVSKEDVASFLIEEFRFPSSILSIAISTRTGSSEEMTALLHSIEKLLDEHNAKV